MVTKVNRLECVWSPPPPIHKLPSRALHVWCTHLDLPLREVQHLEKTLSPQEHQRACRFYFDKHRQRFVVRRGVLRTILAYYLQLAPHKVVFSYGPRGKPALGPMCAGWTPSFNMSHSHELALFAVTHNRPVGIDVEYIRPKPDAEQLSKRFFSPREYKVIKALPPDKKEAAFYEGWTLKEAYLKATGEGLYGLEQVEVDLTSHNRLLLLRVPNPTPTVDRWSAYQLTPAPGYCAAVVAEGCDWNLSCFAYHP